MIRFFLKKWNVLICLLLVFAVLLCSCNTDDGKKENQTPPISEEDQIKQGVIDLLAHIESKKDPTMLFESFDGDFTVSGVTSSNESITSIKRKAAVTEVFTNYGLMYYGVEAASFLFYAVYDQGYSEVVAALNLMADNSAKSTIFTVFGIDSSLVYGMEDEDDEPMPELTLDAITLSEDRKTCTISRDYLSKLAEEIADGMDYSKSQKKKFLEVFEGSGVYNVEKNELVFEISVDNSSLGKISQTMTLSVDKEERVNVKVVSAMSNPSLGILTPVTNTLEYRNVVYDGENPVSATINTSYSMSNEIYVGGEVGYIESQETVKSSFKLDCTNKNKPIASASSQKTTKETEMGHTFTYQTSLTLNLDMTKTTSQFSFVERRDGAVASSVKANKVTFGTPSGFQAVPQVVTNAITDYIMDS